jgi:hypothetical protein
VLWGIGDLVFKSPVEGFDCGDDISEFIFIQPGEFRLHPVTDIIKNGSEQGSPFLRQP